MNREMSSCSCPLVGVFITAHINAHVFSLTEVIIER